jgi:4-hydroxyphenylpyruvate 3-dimethylallyltransferase
MIERHDAELWDPEVFVNHLQVAAESIDAPFDPNVVVRTVEVFEAEFRRCVVQLKATCQSGSGLYYRFFYKWERDLTSLAQTHGMLQAGSSPIVDLQAQVLTLPGSTRAGLDFDTGCGLAKVWTFTGGPVPISELVKLSAIPDSVRNHMDFFEKHGLRHVFFVASDVQQNSMNVYFGMDEDCRREDWIRALAEDTGGTPSDETIYAQMLSSLAISTGIGTTFRWDDDAMGRWGLYGLNVHCENPVPGINLPPLPERLDRFCREAPTLNAAPQYNVAWSFGNAGFYTKLEKSYAKDADYFLTCEMGGNLTHAVGK